MRVQNYSQNAILGVLGGMKGTKYLACIVAALLLLAGCRTAIPASQPTASPAPAAGPGWGSQLAQICGDIPVPGGEQGEAGLITEGSVTTGTTSFGSVKLYDYVQWIGALVQDGWYVFGNEANKDATHIAMTYSTRDETLRLAVAEDSARGVWPEPVTAELDYMVPFYGYSKLVSTTELDLNNYDLAVQCTFENAPEQDVLKYLKELEEAGYRNLGHASGLYVLENGIYEVNVFLDPGGVKPLEIKLLRHTVALVPLPPWPDELPEDYARVLPRMGSPVSSVEQAVNGYTVDVNDVSSFEVYTWYGALPGMGWGAIGADGSAVNAEAGFALGDVNFDSPGMTFGFTIEAQDSEGTATATAAATPQKTAGDGSAKATATTGTHTSGHNTGDVTYTFRLTSKKYEANEVENAVKQEFGQHASVADWAVLKREYAGKADSFLSGIGVKHNEDVWVNRNGTGYYQGPRRYFLAKIDGVGREDFLIHDTWDGNTVWLGSWSGIELRAIALVPSQ